MRITSGSERETAGQGGRQGTKEDGDRVELQDMTVVRYCRTVWLWDVDTHLAGIEYQCANVAVTGTFYDVDGVGGRDAGDDDVTLFLEAHDQL